MAEIEWIKVYLKTFRTSRKIGAIERMKNGDTIIVIWFKLLCLAGEINDDGAIYITQSIPFSDNELASELRRPVSVVQKALETFEQYGMILRDDAGFIRISSWEKYQSVDRLTEIREQNRIRKQKERANKKSRDSHATVTDDVTECHAIEEEGEEDQEFHSFIHSIAREENENDKKEAVKRKYLGGELGGGVVLLSDEQFYDLLDWLGIDEFEHYLAVVRDCELNGKPFKKKTHYQAIIDMATKDRKIKKNK